MSINKIGFICVFSLFFISACSSDLFISHTGNMPSNERISQIRHGHTKQQVINTIGAPSSVVSLDKNTWIYMSSSIKRVAFMEPEEVDRDVLTIEFDKEGKVESMRRLTKKNGKEISVSTDTTQSLGNTPGFFEKFFGGVGGYSPFPVINPKNL